MKILDILDKFDKMKTRTFFIVAAVAFLVAVAIGVTFNFNIELLEINSETPFAIVLPVNAGNITFYNIDGEVVEFVNNPL